MSNKEELPELDILPPNKTVVFYSPIEEDKDVLVRTGTIAEGSCFYHSLLHAYSNDYVSMNIGGRKKFVQRLRASLARKVDKQRWESLSQGLIAKIPFQELVNSTLSDFYKFIKKSEKGRKGNTRAVRQVIRNVIKNVEKDINIYKLITDMIPFKEGFEQTILPNTYEKCNESGLEECKQTLIQYSVKYYKKIFDKLDGKLEQTKIKFA